MNEKEKRKVKAFVKDFLHDTVLYFTGDKLSDRHQQQFEINFEKKFEEYLQKDHLNNEE